VRAICSQLAGIRADFVNANRKRGTRAVAPSDFYPFKEVEQEQTLEEMAHILEAMAMQTWG
jgi:hypothetical protein